MYPIIIILNYLIHKANLKTINKMGKVKLENPSAMPKEEEATKLVEVMEIPGTPFNAVKKEEKWFVAFGPYKITPEQDTYKACLELLENDMWRVIGSYTIAILQEYEKNMRQEIQNMMSQQ